MMPSIAGRKIGVAGFEVEWTEGTAERTGDGGKPDTDILVGCEHGRCHTEGIGAAENFPRCHVGHRCNSRGQVLIDAELDEAVEDGSLGARLIVIDVDYGNKIPLLSELCPRKNL